MLLQSVECEVTHLITCEEVTRSDETDDLFILTRYLTRKFGFRFRSASEGFARLLFIHPTLSSFGNLFRQTVSLGLDGPVGCGP